MIFNDAQNQDILNQIALIFVIYKTNKDDNLPCLLCKMKKSSWNRYPWQQPQKLIHAKFYLRYRQRKLIAAKRQRNDTVKINSSKYTIL